MALKSKSKKQAYVLIDTNIYLEYFEMSSATITSLEELLRLLQSKTLELILPKQVKDEYWRRKEEIIRDMREKIEEQIPQKPRLPSPVKNLIEAKKVQENYSKFKESFNNLVKRYDKEFKKKTKTEELIEDIFKKAEFVDEDENIIQRAYHRFLKRNPPGKNKSYGDAIIWEILLEKFSNHDLVIITDDPDWYSDKDKKFLKEFLKKEWEGKTRYKLNASSSLAEFINQFTGRKTIKKEVIQEEKTPKGYFPLSGAIRLSDPCSSVYTSVLKKRYYCPFCKRDITIELENQFPHLRDSLMDTVSSVFYRSALVVGPSDIGAQCPYCNKRFNLNNI